MYTQCNSHLILYPSIYTCISNVLYLHRRYLIKMYSQCKANVVPMLCVTRKNERDFCINIFQKTLAKVNINGENWDVLSAPGKVKFVCRCASGCACRCACACECACV